MRRFSVPRGCPFCSLLTRGHNPPYPSVWRKPLLCQCRQNLSVRRQDTHYLPWSTGLYSSPRRQYDFGKFPTSKTARIPPPRQDPIPFTTGPLRVAEAEDLLTWSRLPCPKTTKISDEVDVLQPMNRIVSVCTGSQRALSSPPPALGSAAFLSPSTDRSNGDNATGAPGSPDIPGPVHKKLGKRKAPKLEFLLPPSGLLPRPALQQLLWDQGDLPPPPKIPRIDTKKASVSTKNTKGQAIQTSDEVDVLQPMNRIVSVCTGPQRALSSPPPASGSAAFLSPSTDRSNGDNSTGVPGSPDIPGPVHKKLGKRKAPKLEFLLPSSGLLPHPALQQLLWNQDDLPPPPKIPRIDTKKASVSTKNMKGQAIQTSDEVDVLQPMNRMVSVCTGPQRVLSSPPPASRSAAFLSPSTDRSNGDNSTGAPGSPNIPGPLQKKLGKRKAPKLEFLLSPSGLLPCPALQQLLWDQDDLPPPPKIPRIIDTKKVSVTTKNAKGQAIQTSDEVDVLQPMNRMMSVCTDPQRALSSPQPASGSAAFLSPSTDGVSSPGPPAPTPLLYQAAGPSNPLVPSPSLTPNAPTIPISPSALPSDLLPPCRARPSVETPPDAKKDPINLATALASAISHPPRSGAEPLSFSSPSCRMESPVPMCITDSASPPFPATSLAPPLRNSPTVFSTTASCACEDMSWESSLEPAVMDMDTTPASEAAVVSSPTVSSDNTLPFAPLHGCMQQILAANATVSTGTLVHRVPCYPFLFIVNNGAVLLKISEEILAEKNFINVPYIIGINKQEFGSFPWQAEAQSKVYPQMRLAFVYHGVCQEDVSGVNFGAPGSVETVVIVTISVLATIFLASFAALVVDCRQYNCCPRDLLQCYDFKAILDLIRAR
ncbi:Transmembrane protein 98 [Lemmus lemmus]